MSLTDEEKARIAEEERERAVARAQAEAEIKQKQASSTAKGCLGCFGAVVLGAILLGVLGTVFRDDSPEAVAERELSTARAIVTTVCELEMERRLRSPGTADFPFGHVTTVTRTGAGAYRLASYVDSQNGFGATVRTAFVCDVTGSGSEPSGYRLVNMVVR